MSNQAVRDFAERIVALGFRVFVAQECAGYYGIITDDIGARVLSFSFNDGGSLGGNYGPPSRGSGTGWRMAGGPETLCTFDDVRRALNENPPAFCGNGWRKLSTLEDYLAAYQQASRFAEVTAEERSRRRGLLNPG